MTNGMDMNGFRPAQKRKTKGIIFLQINRIYWAKQKRLQHFLCSNWWNHTCSNLPDGGDTTKHIFSAVFGCSSRLPLSLKNGLLTLMGTLLPSDAPPYPPSTPSPALSPSSLLLALVSGAFSSHRNKVVDSEWMFLKFKTISLFPLLFDEIVLPKSCCRTGSFCSDEELSISAAAEADAADTGLNCALLKSSYPV